VRANKERQHRQTPMWKRLTDRISEAVANVATTTAAASAVTNSSTATTLPHGDDDSRIAQLSAMGFRPAEARHALRVSGGDLQRASEWLLENGTPIGIHHSTGNNSIDHSNNAVIVTAVTTPPAISVSRNTMAQKMEGGDDDDIQRAIQASLEEPKTNHHKVTNTKRNEMTKSAAARRAGQAALQRFESNRVGTKSTASTSTSCIASHPQVHIPKRLSQHDREEVIVRCAARIASYPSTVDTLLRSLKTIQAHPTNLKYQTIDTSTAAFQRSLNQPGVMAFLQAMNFHPSQSKATTLRLSILDPATFFLGISALEQVQQTSPEYANNKEWMKFDQEMEQALTLGDSDMQEALKRSEFMSQCPSESPSAGSQVTVELGSSQHPKKISRKFDGDDTLRDVIHWLGSHSSLIPSKLLETKEWHLVDRSHADSTNVLFPYNNNNNNNKLLEDEESRMLDRTLQYVGCWPSGRLAVVPTLPHHPATMSVSGSTTPTGPIIRSSRGLGAGPV
jgi:hypothetical protein